MPPSKGLTEISWKNGHSSCITLKISFFFLVFSKPVDKSYPKTDRLHGYELFNGLIVNSLTQFDRPQK